MLGDDRLGAGERLKLAFLLGPCADLDRTALFDAVVEHGLEGVVAKKRNGIYRPGYRGWTKIKKAAYWRREQEVELVQRRRRVTTTAA